MASTFFDWVRTRRATDTPRGDFIRDARESGINPHICSWRVLVEFLESFQSCDEAIEEGLRLWFEFVDYLGRGV